MLAVSGCASDSFPVCPLVSPDDRLLAAVLGGCALATLSAFSELHLARSMITMKNPLMEKRKMHSHWFYKTVISKRYWLFQMSSKRELQEFFTYCDITSDIWNGPTNWLVDSDGESCDREESKSGNGTVNNLTLC